MDFILSFVKHYTIKMDFNNNLSPNSIVVKKIETCISPKMFTPPQKSYRLRTYSNKT